MSEENKEIDMTPKENISELKERMALQQKKEGESERQHSHLSEKARPAPDTVAIIQMPRSREIRRNERFNFLTALALMDQPDNPKGRLTVRQRAWQSWEYAYLTQLPCDSPLIKTLVKTTGPHVGEGFPKVEPYSPNPNEFTSPIWVIAEHCYPYPVKMEADYDSRLSGYRSISLRQHNPYAFDTSTHRISNANQEMEQCLLAGDGFRRDDWPENEYVFFWLVNGETVPVKAVVNNETSIDIAIYPMRGIKNHAAHFIPSKYKRIDLATFGEHEQSVMLERLKAGHKGSVNFVGTDKVRSLSL